MSLTTCPACGGADLRIFHEQRGLPVHSCLLHADRDEARTYPRGDLRLALCRSCGLIFNTDFDPGLHSYSTRYEETQGFSARFRQFATELAERWVDRWDLHGKSIVEIGCGKAEFLALLCNVGGNTGVGIDPSAIPERADGNLTLIQDFYSEQYADLTGDAVVCRHTLEHIQPVGEFLRTVRRGIGDRAGTAVLFELPDVLRVLREVAFWDVYYEHCTYFTAASLARLFRACDFEVLDLSLEYDGQYLVLDALPAASGQAGSAALAIEEPMSELEAAVDHFELEFPRQISGWRTSLLDACSSGRPAVVWGSGSKGVAYLTSLQLDEEIDCVVDINPYRQGMFMAGTGHPIVGPHELKARRPDVVVAMNPIYLDEIRAELDELEVDAELISV